MAPFLLLSWKITRVYNRVYNKTQQGKRQEGYLGDLETIIQETGY